MMMKRKQILALVCCAFWAGTSVAEVWTAGSQEDFVPFNYQSEDRYVGIDVEILDAAAQQIGVTIDHRPSAWRRALLDFEAKKLDSVFQLTPTKERFEKWNMVGPLRMTQTVFLTRNDMPIDDIVSLSELDGKILGVVSGFTYGHFLDFDTTIIREESVDDFTNVRKLLLGRSDLIVGGRATLAFVVRELNAEDKVKFLPTPLVERARYIAFHKDEAGNDKARRLQKAIDDLREAGTISEIIGKYVNR